MERRLVLYVLIGEEAVQYSNLLLSNGIFWRYFVSFEGQGSAKNWAVASCWTNLLKKLDVSLLMDVHVQ